MTANSADTNRGAVIQLKGIEFSYNPKVTSSKIKNSSILETKNENNNFGVSISDLTINPGEVTTILGPNGSGKSTLLSLIRGRLKPSKGSVLIDNIDLYKLNDLERAAVVGYTPQRSDSPMGFSVEEIIEGGFFRFKKEQAHDSIDDILQRMDLLSMRKRDASTLSGGEFRRVILSRLLAQDPRILLFDEPTGDLDLKYQEKLPGLFNEEAKKGKTIVVILHDINQALLHTDKTILLKNGSIAAFGPTKEVITPGNIEKVYGVKLDYFFSKRNTSSILGFADNKNIQDK